MTMDHRPRPLWPTVALLAGAACGLCLAAAPLAAGEPDIQFADPEEPAPESPTTSPFGRAAGGPSRSDAVPGCVELSTGAKVPGYLYTTRGKRLKIFNLKREVYEYVPVPACQTIEAVVEWQRMQKQWRFKEAGDPEKVYTGKAYPVRKMAWRLTLRNGHRITGHILGQPLYIEHGGKRRRFILHDRDKGPLGATLDDLVYVRRAAFGPRAYHEALDELEKKAEARGADEAD